MDFGAGDIIGDRIKEALDARGARYELEVVDAGDAAGLWADLIFVTDEFSATLVNESAPVVAIQNFTSRSEVREKVAGALDRLRAPSRT
ncbi:PTS sugar transporter subunit IIB [Rubrobacter aplysinae]|uniref:hypothetical protein n=1 Tax=Rubrobacter aplysinae TaxID=909625 RepID=UPI00064BBDD7|nr:hypothetical protein [Rubrobacter aplysinae]